MKIFFLICLMIVMVLPARAQEREVYFHQLAEDYFLLGMRQYAQKDFKYALLSFKRSMESYPLNHRITAAMTMSAKTQYALKNYTEAIVLCDSLLSAFPSTLYAEDVFFTKGMCFYNQGEYLLAFAEMEKTFMHSVQRLNIEHSYKVIEHLAAEFFDHDQLISMMSDSTDRRLRNLFHVILAEKEYQSGNKDKAMKYLERFDTSAAEQSLRYRKNRLFARIEQGNIVRIGVLVPLMEQSQSDLREKKVAQEIVEGIRLAVSDFEEQSASGQVSVEVDVKDSGKDSAAIDSVITQWSEQEDIKAVIGPVYSDETVFAARSAQKVSLPIITPTATDEGISMIGNYVFQANSTNGAKGKTMAQYAVTELGAKTIAVLASSLPSSQIQADSFIAVAKRLGANIVVDRRYGRGESDLRTYVRAIRSAGSNLRPDYIVSLKNKPNLGEITRKLVSLGIKFSYIDSVLSAGGQLNLTPLFGDQAKLISDSLNLKASKMNLYLDSLHFPVTSIDLVYCAISSSNEIGVLTSQLTFFNIRSMLLGSGDWNDANELDLNKRYADGVIFGIDRWIERSEQVQRTFSKYSQRYGRQISENALFGYDVTMLVLQQFAGGILTRGQLAEALSRAVEFRGIRNNITLHSDRVNTALQIIQFRSGAITKLRTYSYH